MPGRVFLVDGTALAYRAHFAFIHNPLTNSKGFPTSSVFGYLNTLLKILRDEEPECVAVAFDRPEPTFRHERFKEYKATREKAPEEMIAQFPIIKEVTQALGIAVLEKPGFEADDLIGTAVKRAEAEGFEVFIVSGDKDMMQLVSDRTSIYEVARPGRSEAVVLGRAAVQEKFGVPPEKVVDVLGLMGDTSDNVPGVPQIGPKTAATLVNEFGSLEAVLAQAASGKPSRTNTNLVEFAQQARLSHELVTIDTNVSMELSFEKLHPGRRDRPRLVELLTELEFSHLVKELGTEGAAEADATGYRIVRPGKELQAVVAAARAAGFFVVDTETTGLDALTAELVGVSLAWKEGEAVYLPCEEKAALLGALRPLLEDASVAKGGQNAKYDLQVLQTHGVKVRNLAFDTMIASYLLDPGRGIHNLDAMALRHLGIRKIATEELIGKGNEQISMAEVPVEKVARYAAEDADCTFRLVQFFRPRLEAEELKKLFDEVEMPLVPVLVAMERHGVRIDADYLRAMSEEMGALGERLAKEIQASAGEEFNVNSPKQLGPILFEKLQIQKGSRRRLRKTKTGYSTDARALEDYADHPIVARLLEYREVTKLKSTYVDALPLLVHPLTGRIHSSFNQTVAATGRLSSADPNLQNIPIRTEMGRRIRRAFVPDEGCLLVSADYNQIELRLMAHLSGDEGLREVYRRGGDVHAETAARMFSVKAGEVTRDQRGRAKAINFGILYGMGPQRLSRDLKVSMDEARAFLEAYFREFPGVRRYQEATVAKARAEGYVMTLLGRRRAIPDIDSGDPPVRANAENMAMNTPLQGTAADLIKVAMIHIHERLDADGYRARMILQVHDELLFEAPVAEVEKLKPMVKREMEGALALDVPVVVDVGVGRNWLEAH
ncbi:MAG: DNA polymerase I [Planctomycetaceae bacterium]